MFGEFGDTWALMQKTSNLSSNILLFTYMVMVVLILVNLFIAVVMDSYEALNDSRSQKSSAYTKKYLVHYIFKGFISLLKHAQQHRSLSTYKSDAKKLYEILCSPSLERVDMSADEQLMRCRLWHPCLHVRMCAFV